MQLNANLADPGDDPPPPPAAKTSRSILHVLTLTPFFPSLENEVSGSFIKEPLDYFAQLGVASSVIAASPIYRSRQHSNPEIPASWVRYPQVPGNLGLSSAGRFLYARLLHEVSRLHRRLPIDVIHAHAALPCGQAAARLARRLRIPYVVTVHGLDVFNSCFGGGTPAQWRAQSSTAVYQDADTVVCISGKVQQILRDGMPAGVRSAVVYNGTDAELFSPRPAAGAAQAEILVVGNLIASKGHELVLRALRHIQPLFPQLQCRIIGEGPDRGRLEALAEELGISTRLHFLGRQSRVAVAEAMRRCSVFALPSRNEGLGCVYLEAMASAKPVIACRGQGIEEVIEHEKNGWLIPADGLNELAQGISTLLGSPDLVSRIGTAARQTVLNGFTLSHQARHLVALYRDVSARGSTTV